MAGLKINLYLCTLKKSMKRKLIIVSAPSGTGKTSIVQYLLQKMPELRFSVSATTRAKRDAEIDGKDYYFFTVEQFEEHIRRNDFLEWQEVYDNQFYGTLKSEVDRVCQAGNPVIFDIDVLGGLNIKKFYGNQALAIFIKPPGMEALAQRLQIRGTETGESLQTRLDKAEYELSFAPQFDKIVLNDNLERACHATECLIRDFLCDSR